MRRHQFLQQRAISGCSMHASAYVRYHQALQRASNSGESKEDVSGYTPGKAEIVHDEGPNLWLKNGKKLSIMTFLGHLRAKNLPA